MKSISLQLKTATLLCVAGVVLLFCGMLLPLMGELHPSLLIAFGEICTFAGGLFGVDYCYRMKNEKDIEEDRISRDFTWEEMVYSETAIKHCIPNTPGKKETGAIQELVKRLLQPLRIAYGKPIRISSGFRSPEVNRLVGGVSSSQDVKGEAADCVVDGPEELLHVLLKNHFPFDQAILYRKRGFIHLSLRAKLPNRKRVIIK